MKSNTVNMDTPAEAYADSSCGDAAKVRPDERREQGENLPEPDEASANSAEIPAGDDKAAADEQPETQLLAQIEELKKRQLYQMAEFDNYRKRVIQEKAELVRNGGAKVITTLLPIVDDMKRAQQNMDKYDDVTAVKEGLSLIIDKFLKLLAQEGLRKMEAVGETFDPDYHEAVAMVPGCAPEKQGTVIDCVSDGYMLNDKVIRFAKVAVAE